MRLLTVLGPTLFLLACGSGTGAESETDEGTGSTGSTATAATTSATSGSVTSNSGTSNSGTSAGVTTDSTTSPGTTTSPTATESSSGSDTEGSGSFLATDVTGDPGDCDLFLNDCPKGEKCTAWANDGGTSWNATRCVPIDPDPDAVGEACTAEDGGLTGIDSCDGESMCFNVDDSNEGSCYAFCDGSVDDPECADACARCSITGDGVLTICLPECDPLAQECGDGEGCYVANGAFTCAPEIDTPAQLGGACENLNGCAAGLMCIAGAALPDCADDACCTTFCEIGLAGACDSVPGTTCEPAVTPGEAGCASETAGLCALAEK